MIEKASALMRFAELGVLTFLLSQLKPEHATSVSLSLTYRSALSATRRHFARRYASMFLLLASETERSLALLRMITRQRRWHATISYCMP